MRKHGITNLTSQMDFEEGSNKSDNIDSDNEYWVNYEDQMFVSIYKVLFNVMIEWG